MYGIFLFHMFPVGKDRSCQANLLIPSLDTYDLRGALNSVLLCYIYQQKPHKMMFNDKKKIHFNFSFLFIFRLQTVLMIYSMS